MSSNPSGAKYTVRDLIPAWIFSWRDWEGKKMSVGQVMELLIEYSGENVRLGPKRFGGGPYAAAIVRSDEAGSVSEDAEVEVLALATNSVETLRDASAHAAVLASRLAGSKLGTHNLGEESGQRLWLLATCEPCRMCLEVLGDFRIREVAFALRGAMAQKIARQERGEPLHGSRLFQLTHLSQFQGAAAEVVRQWKKGQEARMASDYCPPREGG
jgi:tRNA(Arg) A34 adenosine deaminase TadA